MKSTIINILNNILPTNYFVFFSSIDDFLVIKEMGPYKFSIYIFLILLFFCYVILKNWKNIVNKNYIFFFSNNDILSYALIFSFSFFFIYFSYGEYISNQFIFYESTTNENKYNYIIYLISFSLTNLVFYFFAKELTGSILISLVATLFWIASSIHISNLFPSLIRDYLKAVLFLFNFIFLIYFLKNKINYKNLNIVWISLFFLCLSFIIRSDLKMLIPVYLYVLVISLNLDFRNKLKILIFFLIISSLFVYITSSVYEGRVFQRFGAALSSELFELDYKYSIGPFEDSMFFYVSCVFYDCNILKGYFYSYFYDLKLVIVKFFTVFLNVILLPFRYGIIFDETNLIYKVIFFKFTIFSQVFKYKFLYLLILVAATARQLIKKNYFLLNLILIFFYMIFVYTLQNQIRHFFYLEGISILIFIYIIMEIFCFFKKLVKGYVKK